MIRERLYPSPQINTAEKDKIPKIAELSRRAFKEKEPNPSVFEDFLNLGIIRYIKERGRIIAYAVTLKQSYPGSHAPIAQQIPEGSFYAAEAAVDPDYQGSSLHVPLLEDRKQLLRDAGMETFIGTVRAENGASLRNIIKTGGILLAWSPTYFKSEENPARLIWENDITIRERPPAWSTPLTFDNVTENVDQALATEQDAIIIPITSGDDPDENARAAIEKILTGECEYVGVSSNTISEEGKEPRIIGVKFVRLASLDVDLQRRLRARKQLLTALLPENTDK